MAIQMVFSGRTLVARLGDSEVVSYVSTSGHRRDELHRACSPAENPSSPGKCDVAGCRNAAAYGSGNEGICEHHYLSLPVVSLGERWPTK